MDTWIWDKDKDLFEQIPQYLEFITAGMEDPKKLWIRSQYEEMKKYCAPDSPPERILLIQMLVCLHRHIHSGIVTIKAQADIKLENLGIRADFLLTTKVGDFDIECHGNTHLQDKVWRQDMRKARELANVGITYISFSAGEIIYDASTCLAGEEIRELIDRRIARRAGWIRPEVLLDILKKSISEDLGPLLKEYFKKGDLFQ